MVLTPSPSIIVFRFLPNILPFLLASHIPLLLESLEKEGPNLSHSSGVNEWFG
jgi:hypothetical protein